MNTYYRRNVTELSSPHNALELCDRWWSVALRGVAALLFGLATWFAPALSLFALVMLFGAYALVDGVANLVMAVRGARSGRRWGWLVFQGLVSIGAGLLTFMWPGITALALLFIIAAWSVTTGVAAIVSAIRLRKEIRGEWLLGLSGALSIIFGALLVLFPAAGALAVTIWIGAYAVVLGGILIALGFKLRSWGRGEGRQLPSGGLPTAA